jgi:hypothetical protein
LAIGVEKRLIFKVAAGRRGWSVGMGQRVDDGRLDGRPKNAGGDSGPCAAKTRGRRGMGTAVNADFRALSGVMEVRVLGEGRRNKDRRNTAGDCHADQDCYCKFNHCAPSVLLGLIANRVMAALIGSEKG